MIVDEADVLRDEGEAYAARLRAAGVEVTTVRYDGITHDFMMLNPLSATHATRAAIAQAISVLRGALHSAETSASRRTDYLDPLSPIGGSHARNKGQHISSEEAEHGVAELWAGGHQIA